VFQTYGMARRWHAVGGVFVVIPWRGFRCFTPGKVFKIFGRRMRKGVVIPWRGFRCFTHIVVRASEDETKRCNPLAGI